MVRKIRRASKLLDRDLHIHTAELGQALAETGALRAGTLLIIHCSPFLANFLGEALLLLLFLSNEKLNLGPLLQLFPKNSYTTPKLHFRPYLWNTL